MGRVDDILIISREYQGSQFVCNVVTERLIIVSIIDLVVALVIELREEIARWRQKQLWLAIDHRGVTNCARIHKTALTGQTEILRH